MRAGNWNVTVTDSFGCKSDSSKTISPGSTRLTPSIIVTNVVMCAGGKDGEILITENGETGTAPFEYWVVREGQDTVSTSMKGSINTTGLPGVRYSGLSTGMYYLYMRDANGCYSQNIVRQMVTEPSEITVTFESKKYAGGYDVSCEGGSDDEISVKVSGGNDGGYSYKWTTEDNIIIGTSDKLENVPAGKYYIFVTDSKGCVKRDSIIITEPAAISLANYEVNNALCYGYSNGYINISISGGSGDYIYQWTGPSGFTSNQKDIAQLKAGIYSCMVSDLNGCQLPLSFTLTEPDKLDMVINVSSSLDGRYNINCARDLTGYIDIEPVNSIGKVEYLWADGLYGKTRNNLPAGRYSVIITDSIGCYSSLSVTLTEPNPLKINFDVIQPFCLDMANGAVAAEAIGGINTNNYNYQWSNNSTSSSLANIGVGWYALIVEDVNGCIVRDSIKVEAQNRSCLIIPNAISPNGDMINDVWNIENIHLYPEAEVKVFNRWGYNVWVSEKGYPRPWDGTHGGRDLPIDSYHYIIDLHNGNRPIMGTITIVR